jgi:hypothetical protein
MTQRVCFIVRSYTVIWQYTNNITEPSVVILGGKDSGEITFKAPAQYDSACGIVSALLGKTGGSSAPKASPKAAKYVQF